MSNLNDGGARSVESTAGIPRLPRRSWTRVGAIVPGVAVATIIVCSVAAGLTSGTARSIVVVVALMVGIAVGLLWLRNGGAEATHRHVAAARMKWATSRQDASLEADGPADPRDSALALPRGWDAEVARGRVNFEVNGAAVHAETWVLRAVPGSRRARRRREVVRTLAHTGGVRCWLPIGASADSMLVLPRWARDRATQEPAWMPTVRERVARHEDLLATLIIGDERIILFALDDPRLETMQERARLVRDVAALIG